MFVYAYLTWFIVSFSNLIEYHLSRSAVADNMSLMFLHQVFNIVSLLEFGCVDKEINFIEITPLLFLT